MSISNMLDVFLKTGKHPATLKETSAILDLLRSRILNMNTAPTATAPGKPHTPILDKLAASGGKATLSELGAAARPTTAPSKAPADNLPRTSTGRVDSLEITRRQLDQRQAERKAASDAVSRKNPPRRSFVGKQSKYHVED